LVETGVLRAALGAAGAGHADNGPDIPPPADEKHSDDYACVDVAVNVAVRVGEYWDSRTSWRSRLPRRGRGASGAADPEPGPEAAESPEPTIVDVGTPEYATVWRPLVDGFREPRPGLLRSVVRAGGMVAYPTPLSDLATGAAELPVCGGAAERGDGVASVVAAARPAPAVVTEQVAQQQYGEVRALVGVLVEVLAGRRPAEQVAVWLDAGVREELGSPDRARFGSSATLRRVRLSAVGGTAADGGVEAMALVQDGARLRAVAFRFDRVVAATAAAAAEDGSERAGERRTRRGRSAPAWICTALQAA